MKIFGGVLDEVPSQSLTEKAPEKFPKPNRKGKRLPFPPFFRRELLNFGGVYSTTTLTEKKKLHCGESRWLHSQKVSTGAMSCANTWELCHLLSRWYKQARSFCSFQVAQDAWVLTLFAGQGCWRLWWIDMNALWDLVPAIENGGELWEQPSWITLYGNRHPWKPNSLPIVIYGKDFYEENDWVQGTSPQDFWT